MIIYKGLTLERWSQFSLIEQLANIGPDVERTIFWKKNNNLERSRQAFDRFLELLYLTIEDTKTRGAAPKELTRMRGSAYRLLCL